MSDFKNRYLDTLFHWYQRGRDEDKWKMKTKGEHAHRGSMSCCHQWQRGRLLMKLSLMPTWTCSGPTGCHWYHHVPLAVPWSTLYPIDKLFVPTRLDLGATTLLKMLKTLLMVLKTLEMVLKPWWTMEDPYMGWGSINDALCGHSCSDGIIVPHEKTRLPHRWCHDGSWPLRVS